MKEIKLEIDNEILITSKFQNNIKISHRKDGYYITKDNEEIGPFLKIFTDQHKEFDNDTFIYGFRGDNITIYRDGVYGLEVKDTVDTTTELIKSIRKVTKNITLDQFKHCELLGYVHVYTLAKREGDAWEKDDGFVRDLIPNSKRLIYRTPENQVFAVNPDKIQDYSRYKKFDSFEELRFAVKSKGFDYGYEQKNCSVNNRNISEFVYKLQKNKVPARDIISTLNEIKELIGVENFRRLSSPIKSTFVQHDDINLEELYGQLRFSGFDNVSKACREYTAACQNNRSIIGGKSKLQFVLDREINENIDKLDYRCQYGELSLTCEGQELFKLFPQTDETEASYNNSKLYNWRGLFRFYKETPEYFDEIIRLMQYKIKEEKLRQPKEQID